MHTTVLGLVLVVGLALVCSTFGYQFSKQTDPETVHGKLVFFCEYKGLRLLPKSKFRDLDDCVFCKCDKTGNLNCSSLGGTIGGYDKSKSKCIDVSIGCKTKWVFKNNDTKKCPKKHIPPHGAVGK